ncbi:CLUMA_CG020792, isoform A [Clunio marinus]|uniref:CLUMA_CG020792, isoform A n=1 Tax=Clunio marinus TaxID=568069 RepID=A0A1J1J8P9_9DIPT|nr:CLUMA_CG020792, isoform A [Clunio marinus]
MKTTRAKICFNEILSDHFPLNSIYKHSNILLGRLSPTKPAKQRQQKKNGKKRHLICRILHLESI